MNCLPFVVPLIPSYRKVGDVGLKHQYAATGEAVAADAIGLFVSKP